MEKLFHNHFGDSMSVYYTCSDVSDLLNPYLLKYTKSICFFTLFFSVLKHYYLFYEFLINNCHWIHIKIQFLTGHKYTWNLKINEQDVAWWQIENSPAVLKESWVDSSLFILQRVHVLSLVASLWFIHFLCMKIITRSKTEL